MPLPCEALTTGPGAVITDAKVVGEKLRGFLHGWATLDPGSQYTASHSSEEVTLQRCCGGHTSLNESFLPGPSISVMELIPTYRKG